MTTNPYRSPDTVSQSPELKSGQLKRTLLTVLTVTGVLVLLAALLLPARRGARETGRQNTCRNNLRSVALALIQYEKKHHSLPPAYTVDAEGKPLHSWRTLILPFLEEQALYETIDLSKPWDDPANKAAYETPLTIYQCPTADCPATHTTYLAVIAHHSYFQPTEPRKPSEISDSTDLTLMLMEVDASRAVHWMSPTDATEQSILSFGSVGALPHPNGAHVATASCKVFFMPANLPPAQLRALISIDGNDDAIASQEF